MDGISLKHKLLALWFVSALALLLLVGIIFMHLITEYHLDNAHRAITEAFATLDTEINAHRHQIERQAALLAQRDDVVATLNMITTYQDPDDYRSLIFDPEKRRLAMEMANQARVTALDQLSAYDAHGRLASFFISGAGNDGGGDERQGYLSYANGKPRWLLFSDPGGERLTETERPECLARGAPSPIPQTVITELRLCVRGLGIVAEIPVWRILPGKDRRLVGVMRLEHLLGNAFVREFSARTGQELALRLPDGRTFGATGLPSPPAPVDTGGIPPLEKVISGPPLWLTSGTHFSGAATLPTEDGQPVVAVIGTRSDRRDAGLIAFQQAALVALLAAGLFTTPLVVLFTNRAIGRPVESLVTWADRLRRGDYVLPTHPTLKGDLKRLAGAFEEMAANVQQREQELGSSRERYRNLFARAPIAIWEEDFSAVGAWLEGLRRQGIGDLRTYLREHPEESRKPLSLVRIVNVNQTALVMFEADDKDQLLTNLAEVFPETGLDNFNQELLAIWEQRNQVELECSGRTLKGRHIDFVLRWSAPMENGHLDLGRVIVAMLDITQRKSIENQLREAKNGAEAASRAKSEFLSVMSHEIRTPMNSVLGMAELLAESPLDSEQHHYVRALQRNGELLLDLINEVLNLSKIEAGTLALLSQPFDLAELMNEVVESFRQAAEKKGILLMVKLEPGLTTRRLGDRGQLRHALINLVGNAVKFTDRGEVALSARRTEKIADGIRLSVSDTGIGVPLHQHRVIFEPFIQGDSSTTRNYGGSGLGLALSLRLARLMGGDIQLESSPGEGSRFHLSVPLPPAETVSPPAPDENGQPRELPPLRILLAEDAEDNVILLRSYLRKTAATLEVAENGREAVEMFRAGDYDLVLMDMQMPVMDGYQATREIRALESGGQRHCPILALTAHALEGDEEKSLAAGCDLHLTKPIKKKALLAALARYAPDTSQVAS